MFLADFHVHTNFSDGQLSMREVVDFYGRQGFGCIAITDHLCEQRTLFGRAARALDLSLTPANYQAYLDAFDCEAARAWDQYGMVLLSGYEISKNYVSNARSAHILAIGVRGYIAPEKDAVEIARDIHAEGGLCVAAHPVWTRKAEKQTYYLWDRREELRGHIDAWEVASGRTWFSEVEKSGLPILANSDLHRPEQIRAWKTVLHCERHPEAIVEAVRTQQIGFHFFVPQMNELPAMLRPDLQVARSVDTAASLAY